jgi:hypothetical protein
MTVAILRGYYLYTDAEDAKPTITAIESSAGLYFDEIGSVFFYPTQWKIVSYVGLKPTQRLWRQVKTHQSQIAVYCYKVKNATWYSLTDCSSFTPYIKTEIRYIEQLKVGGDILRFLFGILTQSDAQKYTQHIQELETEQQSFLRILQEQMIILKSAITSFNLNMQKVNKNEKILTENLQRLNQLVVNEINKMQYQLDAVLIINENIRQIQRGISECQHTFEILVDTFLHAQDIIQPQLIMIAKVKDMMKELSLPNGLDLPPFPSLEFSRLITPIIFSKQTCLVYILQVPLFQSTMYQLYRTQLFPFQEQDNVFVYVDFMKDYIFVYTMRHKYGKLNNLDLQSCFKPNELNYVRQETVPIHTYTPNEHCKATLIHPSNMSLPTKVCEQSLLKLEPTYWIPLHMSYEWLFTSPKDEIFTVLCGSNKFHLTLQHCGKLYLPPRCKGCSAHTTMYALSTITQNNSKEDILPLASVDLDCCLTEVEREQL